MKLKSLNKKIRRLVASIAKNTKKLDKLRRKLTAAPKQTSKKEKTKKKKTAPTAKAAPRKKQKQKRRISPERRAQLAAMMKERWAAKRAAAASGTDSGAPVGSPS